MAAAPQNHDDAAITGINVTPLVDVMLVLLIVFMVTASLIQTQALGVNLPQAKTGDAALAVELRVDLTKEGVLRLNDQEAALADVAAKVDSLRKDGKPPTVSIAADRAAPHGAVIDAVDALRASGVAEFAFTVLAE